MKTKLFSYISILLLFYNCATFNKIPKSKTDLTENNLLKIDGTYNNSPDNGGGFYVNCLSDILDRNTKMFNFKKKYEGKNLIVKLNLISPKKLNFKIYNDSILITDKILKIRIKKDGFIYLKEKRLMIDGFPLVFGGWNVQKSRLFFDSNNTLHIQTNYFFCNGILIVMSDWKTFNYDLIFYKQ